MKISKFFYKLNTKQEINKRIVVLSDVHYYNKKNIKKLNKVFKYVSDQKPDYICIPGDLIDQRYIKDEGFLLDWLKRLKKICPVIISIGNHELIYNKKDFTHYDVELFDKINKIHDVYVLDNISKKFGLFNFIGLSLPGDYYYKYGESNNQFLVNYINHHLGYTPKGYNILLCHSPIGIINKEVFDQINISKNIDLVLCGHTHGGITPNILKKRLKGVGLISPHRSILVPKSYGKYSVDDTDFIISSGITKSSHKNKLGVLDFLFSPEITVVDIKKIK